MIIRKLMKPVHVFGKGATIPNATATINEVNFVSLVKREHCPGAISRRNFALWAVTENRNGLPPSHRKSIRHQIIFCQEADSDEDALAVMLSRGVTCLVVRNEVGAVTGRVEMEAVIAGIIAEASEESLSRP